MTPVNVLAAIQAISEMAVLAQAATAAVTESVALIRQAQTEGRDITDAELAIIKMRNQERTDRLVAILGQPSGNPAGGGPIGG